MKKILVSIIMICNFLFAQDRELTLVLDKNSIADVHYIDISWNSADGKSDLTKGPIVLAASKQTRSIPISEEHVKNGIYITRIQAKSTGDHPKSFFQFETENVTDGIKINFPKTALLNPTYSICIGPKCTKAKNTVTKELHNDHTNTNEAFNLTCTEHCPGEEVK